MTSSVWTVCSFSSVLANKNLLFLCSSLFLCVFLLFHVSLVTLETDWGWGMPRPVMPSRHSNGRAPLLCSADININLSVVSLHCVWKMINLPHLKSVVGALYFSLPSSPNCAACLFLLLSSFLQSLQRKDKEPAW